MTLLTTLIHVQDRTGLVESRYAKVKGDSEKIHALVQENLTYFQAAEESEDWKNYVEYLDDVVLDGLFECIHCSLSYFLENTDKERMTEAGLHPFMESKFELQVRNKQSLILLEEPRQISAVFSHEYICTRASQAHT